MLGGLRKTKSLHLIFCSQDLKLQALLAPALGQEFRVVVEPDREKILEQIGKKACDVVILDLDSDSAQCSIGQQVNLFEDIHNSVAIVAMTDDDSRSTAIELVERGAYGYFRKPPALRELKAIVCQAYEHATLKSRLEPFPHSPEVLASCDRLIGTSAPMQAVYDLVRRVADLSVSVLLTGPSGTGKELVARAIHNLGQRATRPFIAVSCGAIPETLIESELFGNEKGAFTGANSVRQGYLEQAGDGTLFLDEIGELSLYTQVKLLRVLQQKEFSRLGSNRLIPLNARVLFATHRDLAQMIEARTFRRDLYYRLNVARIRCPALAERTEDIADLAHHFLNQYSAQYQKLIRRIKPTTRALLEEYSWPGNVRELENVIQQALIVAKGDSIGPEDLPEELQQFGPGMDTLDAQGTSFVKRLQQFKFRLAMQAIEECNGNKTLAARRLNISRRYLHHLVKGTEDSDPIEEGVTPIDSAVGSLQSGVYRSRPDRR